MAASRPTLPQAVTTALEEYTKATQLYGWWAGQPGAQDAAGTRHAHQRMVLLRADLVRAIENHANMMYEGGIEMGVAQAGASAR